MSSLLEGLMNQLGGDALEKMSQQTGASRGQMGSVLGAALPAILGGLAKNSKSREGARRLDEALARDHDGGLLENLSGFLGSGQGMNDGAKILGHIFGRQKGQVQQQLGQQAGLSQDSMGKVMAMLAPIVMAQLGKAKREQGLDASALSGMLGQQRSELKQKQPAIMGLLGGLMDADGDGDVDAQDIAKKGMGLLSRLFGRR